MTNFPLRAVFLPLFFTLSAAAANRNWNAASGSWFAPGNWLEDEQPLMEDSVTINNGGTCNVDGTNANCNVLNLGSAAGAEGHLTVPAGGQLFLHQAAPGNGDVFIAANGTAGDDRTGSVTVAGGELTARDISVGRHAIGTLTVSGGKVVVNNTLHLSQYGSGVGADGTLNIQGGNTYAKGMNFGPNKGIATMNMTGGVFTNDGTAYMASTEDAYASIHQSGGVNYHSVLYIGNKGPASVTLTNTAFLYSPNGVRVGNAAEAHGILNLHGGTFQTAGDLRNDFGAGEVHVRAGTHHVGGHFYTAFRTNDLRYVQTGGSLNITGYWRTAYGAGSASTGTVSGGNLYVGVHGYFAEGAGSHMTLNISTGAAVSMQDPRFGYGADAGTQFRMNGGALEARNGRVYFGHGARSAVTALCQNAAIEARYLRWGSGQDSIAHVVLDKSSVVVTSDVESTTGTGAQGFLLVTNGAQVTTERWVGTGDFYVSANGAATSTVTLADGLVSNRYTIVARAGTGILNIDGGLWVCDQLWMGQYPPKTWGAVNVNGGRLRVLNQLAIGYHHLTMCDDSTFNQNGGTVEVIGNDLFVGRYSMQSNSQYNLNGGVLYVPNAIKTLAESGPQFNFTGGTLAVGNFYWYNGSAGHAALTNAGGIVSPGYTNIGFTRIQDDYTETSTGAGMFFQIAGNANRNTDWDWMDVVGACTLKGRLQVSIVDGFEETAQFADTFVVLESGADIAGSFDNVASGQRVFTEEGHSLKVFYGPDAAAEGYDPRHVTLTGFVKQPDGTVFILK